MVSDEEVQHQHHPYSSHEKRLEEGLKTSAVLFNSRIEDSFEEQLESRQGCLVSPTLFQIFLQRMITDASKDHEGTVSTGGRTITNLRFADDIDGLAGEKEE
ncbi:reverse transcriptase domain-containing protein [Thiolapillus sp.]|uniref:reverse transcriptase domain-containing protein n=2 Tax=Thiolapillus sp. TaxID=2017437 RepID=UPI003AF7C146